MLKPVVLKNNISILRFPRSNTRTCVVGFVVSTGSSHEHGFFPQGISYLVERMFNKGTAKFPNQRALNLTIESIGAQFESCTFEEHMHFYIQAPAEHQNKALSILSEIIQNSLFDPLTIEREKKKIVEELKFSEEKPLEMLSNAVMSDIFVNNGLGQSLKGNIDSILSIQAEDVLEYLSHQFINEKSYIILGGNFDNKSLLEKVEQEWLHYNSRNKRFLDTPSIAGLNDEDLQLPAINYRQRGLPQTYLAINFLSNRKSLIPEQNTQTDVERLVQYIRECFLACLLGDGISSKLWLKVVEDEVLAHYVTATVDQFSIASLFQIQTVVDNSQFTFALESILSVLESLKKTTVSINEIAKTKEILKGKWILDQEPIISEIIWQMDMLFSFGQFVTLEDIFPIVDQIDAIMIRDLTNNLFSEQNLSVTTLGTAKETRLVEKLLKRYLG